MIHQLIFAQPKPGMTETDFQSYWLNVHAQRFARHIPQIRRYAINVRTPIAGLPHELPGGYSVAEIWLANDEEQLASLQSPEFLEGARRDEPRWAAFWATFGLDTDPQTLLEGPPFAAEDPRVKLLILLKRRPGMEVDEFRRIASSSHADLVRGIPGLRHYVQGTARDGAYAIGEPRFDAVEQLWFDDEASLRAAIESDHFRRSFTTNENSLFDARHLFALAAQAHWVIGPEFRDPLPSRPGGDPVRLCEAVSRGDHDAIRRALTLGADPNERDADSGLTALMLAAGRGDEPAVRMLLDGGADVHTTDPKGGCTALHKACQGGNPGVARALIEAGAFVDAVAVTTGHTPLWDALWYKWPEIVGVLLQQGAGLGHKAAYGFTLEQHITFEEDVNPTPEAREKFRQAREQVEARRQSDQDTVVRQQLMAAVVRNDLPSVQKLLAGGAKVDERSPRLNGFNDLHTPLLVACRDGHSEIAAALIQAGADVNAVEPIFGAVPLHKAVYNGHADITALLAEQPDIDLDFQGATNGYTPLHDALWHGFRDCARILIDANARLDPRGHDGKTPLDIAVETFGSADELVDLLRQKGAEQHV
ncbi:EthD family reductase [Tautonia marina]|uniref:EthD family reductase n=1 Tax=Tautonia marina TaxID=2653855 RepID=UPI00137585AA|nr:EthD family reductase [Tautonia marina]